MDCTSRDNQNSSVCSDWRARIYKKRRVSGSQAANLSDVLSLTCRESSRQIKIALQCVIWTLLLSNDQNLKTEWSTMSSMMQHSLDMSHILPTHTKVPAPWLCTIFCCAVLCVFSFYKLHFLMMLTGYVHPSLLHSSVPSVYLAGNAGTLTLFKYLTVLFQQKNIWRMRLPSK